MQWSGRDTSLTVQKQRSLFGKSSYMSEAPHLSSKFCLWCCTVILNSQWVLKASHVRNQRSVCLRRWWSKGTVELKAESKYPDFILVMPVTLCHGEKIMVGFWKTQMLIAVQCLGNASACLSSNKNPSISTQLSWVSVTVLLTTMEGMCCVDD